MANINTKAELDTKSVKKDKYKVVNWSSYNKSLVNRGNITLWIDESAILNWYEDGFTERGAPRLYSDQCIVCLLCLKAVFKLAYRQLEGFSQSILDLMETDLKVPSYSQICRRASSLELDISVPQTKAPIHIVMDSTGLKVYGEGEWKARKHGASKRRTWRKLHLGVDEKTGFIHAQLLTGNGKGDGDGQQVEELLDQVESPIEKMSGDGGYDTYQVWCVLKEKGIKGIIPPQENALYWVNQKDELLDLDRNQILMQLEKISREEWKVESGYHRRSLSETAMYRFKKTFGASLYSRIFEKQQREVAIKIKCLNKMTGIGMPVSIKVN